MGASRKIKVDSPHSVTTHVGADCDTHLRVVELLTARTSTTASLVEGSLAAVLACDRRSSCSSSNSDNSSDLCEVHVYISYQQLRKTFTNYLLIVMRECK